MADGLTHPPDQAVPSLVNDYPEHAWGDGAHLCRRARPVFEVHTLAEATQSAGRGHSCDLGQILLFDSERGMRQPLRKFAVIGEQEKAFCGGVETTYREHPGLGRHEVHNLGATLRIGRRGDDSGRLVEQIADEAGPHRQSDSVHFDQIAIWLHFPAERGDLAVHLDPARRDQKLAGPTAAEPAPRQGLLQPLFGRAFGFNRLQRKASGSPRGLRPPLRTAGGR